jgi:hypothetical protein
MWYCDDVTVVWWWCTGHSTFDGFGHQHPTDGVGGPCVGHVTLVACHPAHPGTQHLPGHFAPGPSAAGGVFHSRTTMACRRPTPRGQLCGGRHRAIDWTWRSCRPRIGRSSTRRCCFRGTCGRNGRRANVAITQGPDTQHDQYLRHCQGWSYRACGYCHDRFCRGDRLCRCV